MQVKRLFEFEAAHILPNHPGKCRRLHGHSWKMEVELHGRMDDATGFVMDFTDLKRLVQPIVDRFDHRLLNCFVRYPSSENIAIHVAHLLRPLLNWEMVSRLVVRVSETRNTWAEWDSDIVVDQDVFDAKTLDSAQDKEDAGWRSPAVVGVSNVAHTIKELEKLVPEMWQVFVGQLVQLEQLKLYVDSLDFQPELPKELLKDESKERQVRADLETANAGPGTQTEEQTIAVVDEIQKLQERF